MAALSLHFREEHGKLNNHLPPSGGKEDTMDQEKINGENTEQMLEQTAEEPAAAPEEKDRRLGSDPAQLHVLP